MFGHLGCCEVQTNSMYLIYIYIYRYIYIYIYILAGADASGGFTCYGASYARQSSISCTCMESPIEIAANENCHLL